MTTANQAIDAGTAKPRRGALSRWALDGVGRLFAWCRNFVRSQLVAEGYEDAEGFDYGKEPHPNCVNLDQYSRKAEERKSFETTRTASRTSKQGKPVSVSVTRSESPARGRRK